MSQRTDFVKILEEYTAGYPAKTIEQLNGLQYANEPWSWRTSTQRAPVHHDFFVHASFPNDYSSASKEYLERILCAVRGSQSPVSVSSGLTCEIIPENRRISTIPYPYTETGKISRSQAERLQTILDGFHPEDTFRIHGAYFGRCTAEFATQLFGLVYQGEFWPDFPDPPVIGVDKHAVKRELQSLRKQALLEAGAFAQSNIKYGIVLDDKGFPLLHSRASYYTKELTRQLSDLETVVF